MSGVMTLKRYPSQGGMTFGKIGARRMVRTLPYDAEVEYLESTGTVNALSEYIDTGVIPNDYAHPRSWWAYKKKGKNDRVVIGGQGSNNRWTSYDDTRAQVGLGDSTKSLFTSQANLRCDVEITWDTMTGKINDSSRSDYTGGKCTGTITLFTYGQGGFIASASHLEYGFKFWDGDIVIRDMIPVRIGSVGAMYDKRGVGGMNGDGTARNDGLYFNRGTGAFIVGPDKVA